MGVIKLQLLVCGQLILFSFAAQNTTYPHLITESPLKLSNMSQTEPTTTAPPLNTTGSYTKNNSSSLSSNSTYNSDTNLTTSTSQMTPTRPQSTALTPKQSNVTATGSTRQPNTTAAHTTQSSTSASRTTVNTSSTAFTSRYNTNSTTRSTALKTSPVTKTTAKASTTVTQKNSTDFIIHSLDTGLNHSEKSLTILFSILLGVIVLIVLVYFVHKFSKRKQTRIQYTHRRLQNEDTGEPFAAADDTLVISGGLYDGPQIYNPTMTVQNEEDFQADAPGFPNRPTQFRLEFLREDQERTLDHETSTFQTFHANDQES